MNKLFSCLLVLGAFVALSSSVFACDCSQGCKCNNECNCTEKCTQECNCGCQDNKTCECKTQNCNCLKSHKFRFFKKIKCECK